MGRKPAGPGDNINPVNQKLLREHASGISQQLDIIVAARNRIKAIKASARNDKLTPSSLSGAVQDLRLTADKLRAQQERADERQQYYDICKDLPLFAKFRDEDKKEEEENEAA